MLDEALTLITAEQAKHANSPHIQMMGEQLKDLCRREPKSAELVAQDLRNPDMGLDKLKKTFDDFAKKHETKSGQMGEAGITPAQGERLIRTFYGLPQPDTEELTAAQGAAGALPDNAHPPGSDGADAPLATARGKVLSIFDFM